MRTLEIVPDTPLRRICTSLTPSLPRESVPTTSSPVWPKSIALMGGCKVCADTRLIVDVLAKSTVRINLVVLLTPAPVAVIVRGKLPGELFFVAFMVSTVEQFRLQLICEKDPVAPAGRPEIEKEMF